MSDSRKLTYRAPKTPADGVAPHPQGKAPSAGAVAASLAPAGPATVKPVPPEVPGAPQRGTSGARTWAIELPAGMELLSLNRQLHWAQQRRIKTGLEDATIVLARKLRIPHLERIAVVSEYQPPTSRGRRDADNIPVASAKPCIDGLKKAGVIDDDACPKYVTGIEGTIGEPFPKGRLVIHVTEVTG